LFEGHSKFTIIDDILQTASAFNLTALVSEKLDTAQFIGTDRLGANDLVLDQVFQRKPFVARSARDDVAHQNLEHKRWRLPKLAGCVLAHDAGREIIGLELVRQAPRAVQLPTIIVHTLNRRIHYVCNNEQML